MYTAFNSDLVVLLGNASDEFDNVVEVKKIIKKNLLLNKPRKHLNEKRLPTRRPYQVEDIKPPMIRKRKLCRNRCLNRLQNLR